MAGCDTNEAKYVKAIEDFYVQAPKCLEEQVSLRAYVQILTTKTKLHNDALKKDYFIDFRIMSHNRFSCYLRDELDTKNNNISSHKRMQG